MEPLTPAVLHVLLVLAEGDRHGYAIAQEVETLTEGRVKMGPGTLYGTIQRLLSQGVIAPVAHGPRDADERRRYYRLTAAGRRTLNAELARLDAVVGYARARNLIRGPELA